MKPAVFEELCSIVYAESGIRLGESKRNMVSARLSRRLRSLGLDDEVAYLEYLQQNLADEAVELLNAISTNVTHFFRDEQHFDFFGAKLREWKAGGQRRFRVWCAASSTGEEPYSLLMTMAEALGTGKESDYRLLASDICTDVLEHASNATYSVDKLNGVSNAQRSRYMDIDRAGQVAVMKPELRERAVFSRINLAKPPFQMKGPLDFIFCRNVMIYFDDPVRLQLVREFRRLLRPDGFIVVSSSESFSSKEFAVDRVAPSIYQVSK